MYLRGKNELLSLNLLINSALLLIFKLNEGFSNGAISLLSSSTQTVNLAFLRWPINDGPKHDHFSHQLLNYSSPGTLWGRCSSSCQVSMVEPGTLWQSSGNQKIPRSAGQVFGSGAKQKVKTLIAIFRHRRSERHLNWEGRAVWLSPFNQSDSANEGSRFNNIQSRS